MFAHLVFKVYYHLFLRIYFETSELDLFQFQTKMRRLSVALPAALAVRFQTAAPAASTTNSKQQVLHKILTGEVQFKNKALVKDSNVELQFGANWKKELEEYASKLPAAEKKTVLRQAARLNLTRYTTRELAQYAGEVESVDVVAAQANVQEGVAFFQAKGEADFTAWLRPRTQTGLKSRLRSLLPP